MKINSYILAIDSATSILRIGLSLPSGEVYSAENRDRFRHAEFIFKLIDDILQKTATEKSQLNCIAVSIGPGSFTGLRAGLASAKALALSLKLPLIGISTFSAIAERLNKQFGRTNVLIPSRRDEFYFGVIDSSRFDDSKINIIKTSEINKMPVKGNILAIDFELKELDLTDFTIISSDEFGPQTEDIITIAQKRLEISDADNINKLQPLYIQAFPSGDKK